MALPGSFGHVLAIQSALAHKRTEYYNLIGRAAQLANVQGALLQLQGLAIAGGNMQVAMGIEEQTRMMETAGNNPATGGIPFLQDKLDARLKQIKEDIDSWNQKLQEVQKVVAKDTENGFKTFAMG